MISDHICDQLRKFGNSNVLACTDVEKFEL
jgi:hypothetical protein